MSDTIKLTLFLAIIYIITIGIIFIVPNYKEGQIVENELIVSNIDETSNTSKNCLLSKYELNIKYIPQLPELPTGCEVTSACMVLNYYNFNIDKITLCDEYLPKTKKYENWYEKFIGDPHLPNGLGCGSIAITNTINKFLKTQNTLYHAKDISRSSIEDIISYISNNTPVIMWVTIDMVSPCLNGTWEYSGTTYKWYSPEHCVVITGYDLHNNLITYMDPLRGNQIVSIDKLKLIYKKMGSQAVILQKKIN